MKIIIDNFYYKGHHFDCYECDMPNVNNLDEVSEDKITEYVVESLNKFIDEQSEGA